MFGRRKPPFHFPQTAVLMRALIDSLRQIGKPPPEGLWSTEIQKRCYCFRAFLINHSQQLGYPLETLDSTPHTFKGMVNDAKEYFHGDWPAYCAHLLESEVPPPFNADSFEAACRYLVTGENEQAFVPKSTLEAADKHINNLYKQWLEQSL